MALFCTSTIKKILMCFLLTAFVLIGQIGRCESIPSRDQERAIAFVVEHEATDYAFEARRDVCIGFATDLSIDQKGIFRILNGKGFKFHTIEWCNQGPRGVTISVDRVTKTGSSSYEIRTQIGDNDPIRLYGEHFATLLRNSTYVISVGSDSVSVIESYQEACCTNQRAHQARQLQN